jgi:hypothetical protein
VSLVARVQKFKKDMASAGNSVRGVGATARQVGSQVANGLPMLGRFAGRLGLAGIALGAVAATDRLTSLDAAQLALYDSVGKTSAKLGIQAERLQELNYAGELTGVNTNTMNMALQRMTRRVAEAAKGTGEAKGALAELNISAVELAALSPDKQLAAIANEFSKISSQSDKVRLAFKLFDSEGVALVNTLAGGVDGLNKLTNEASGTGAILSGEEIANIEKMNDATTRLDRAWDGLFKRTKVGFNEQRAKITDDISFAVEGLARWWNGVDEATQRTVISTAELNKVYDAQAAIREKQAKIEAKRKEERKKEFDELEKTIAAEKEGLEAEIARARMNTETLGMSPEQRRIAELQKEYADNAINSETADVLIAELKATEQIRKEHERVEELRRAELAAAEATAKQNTTEADALRESLKSSKERMADEVARIQGLRDSGNINYGTQRAAIQQMLKGITPESGRLTGAMAEGSREARSLVLRGNVERPEDETAKNTGEMRDLLENILDNLEADELIASAAGETKQWQ